MIHKHSQRDRKSSSSDTQREAVSNCIDHRDEYLLSRIGGQTVDEGVSHSRDCILDFGLGGRGQNVGNEVLGQIQGYRIRHRLGNRDPADASARDEADRGWDLFGQHEPLGDGEGGIDEEAGADSSEDFGAVDEA